MGNGKYFDLFTEEGEALSGTPWDVYPRPQLRRRSFFNLNGKWDFAVSENGEVPSEYPMSIRVPFAPESLLSGVHRRFSQDELRYYRRSFALPDGFKKGRVLLHFGAVDQEAEVYLNGVCIGSHRGGYDPFCFDVTDHLREENELTVCVADYLDDRVMPYGKQKENRGGMWYTPVSGIWQTVWLESVPEKYICGIKTDILKNGAALTVEGAESGEVIVSTESGFKRFALEGGRAIIELEDVRKWSPEDPYLYRFVIVTDADTVGSYFAVRSLEIKEIDGVGRLCLNGEPYFFHGILDQGYWSDGLFTPATPKGFEKDILAMKELGFNVLRKHIKVEPERFYYDCDRLGMIVFQDMVNNGKYSFFRDTLLPTVGLKKLPDEYLHRDKETRRNFIYSMEKTVKQLYNHPCICLWTVFNEGWGQFSSAEMYEHLLKLDSSRFIDTASGWFKSEKSDVISHHVYFRPYKHKPDKKPVILSEFGGYSYKPEGHVYNTGKTYAYKFFEDREEYVEAVLDLYENEILPAAEQGLSGAVYTQVSDIEDETNGILSYDRRITKLPADRFSEISQKLKGGD